MNKLKITLLLFVFTSLNGVYSSDSSDREDKLNTIRAEITLFNTEHTDVTAEIATITNSHLVNPVTASWQNQESSEGSTETHAIAAEIKRSCGADCSVLDELKPDSLIETFSNRSFHDVPGIDGNPMTEASRTWFQGKASSCATYECIREITNFPDYARTMGCGFAPDNGCKGIRNLFERYDSAREKLGTLAAEATTVVTDRVAAHSAKAEEIAKKLLDFSNETDPLNVATLASQLMLLKADVLEDKVGGLKDKIKEMIQDSIIGKYIDAQIAESNASLVEAFGKAEQRCDQAAKLAKASKALACSSQADLAGKCQELEREFDALFTPADPAGTATPAASE